MNTFLTLFERIGIPEKVARIYLDLLDHGGSSIADICQRTELHRPEVYRALPYLIEEKLVREYIKWKRNFYNALSPVRIEEMARDFEKRSAPLIDQLKNKFENLGKDISVSYQEWRSGVSRVFDDIVDSLPKGSVFYRISAENDITKSNTYLPKDYRERRDKKWLERRVISSEKAATPKQKRLERDIVVIPREYDEFDQDVTMTVYGNKVAYIDFTNESSIIIENAMIADFQKKLFMLTYRKLKK